MRGSEGVAICAARGEMRDRALALAEQLGLEYVDAPPLRGSLYLAVDQDGLGIRRSGSRQKAVRADFVAPSVEYRRRFGGGYREPLARAVGVSGKHKPSVLDMTAGLGRDSFILASLGCPVTMVERSRVVAALLMDGLERARGDGKTATIVDRMELIVADSVTWLEQVRGRTHDVIYIDPMFPARRKSALVKGEMQMLHELLGTDEPVEPLLAAALGRSRSRAVVKRPRLADPAGGTKPDFSPGGRRSRFDVYLQAGS